MIKSSESVDVIIRDLELNPSCQHGPAILFSLRKSGKKFFACAGIRNRDCFYLPFEDFETGKIYREPPVKKARLTSLSFSEVQSTRSDLRMFCKTCGIFVRDVSTHETHNLIRGLSDDLIKLPSLFLPQLDDDKFNAQYFFDDNTLDFICSMFDSLNLRKIICIGAPRLHDFIRNTKPKLKTILLDIDDRFQPFNHPEDMIHYNMFNDYFFNDDEHNLLNFLKDDQQHNTQHCIFTDPPFAARTELFASTFKKFSLKFQRVNSHHKMLPVFLIFPYFNELHIRKEMPEMEMLDFQVNYMNHRAYREDFKGRKAGSPIRIFTNVEQKLIKFPSRFVGYRFCSSCHRSVAANNLHCKICKVCPSKNGATYRHCTSCVLCVKPNYNHCPTCNRCVPKANHDCAIFQKHQECWLCSQHGHVEKNCQFMKKLRHSKAGACPICRSQVKHNLKKCPMRKKFKLEIKT